MTRYRHVALVGRAGAGKDTVGHRLVVRHGFHRVAIADPIKRAAMILDPVVGSEPAGVGTVPLRLSDHVRRHGWDTSKALPEVRRTLQRLGEAVREVDPDVWLRPVLDSIATADRWVVPVVVTDLRYRNEADALRALGFLVVRVVRPGHGEAATGTPRHESEHDLDDYPVDATLTNAGTVAALRRAADALVVPR